MVVYLKPGQGRQPSVVFYDRRVIPDIAAWLMERLGPLARIGEVRIPTPDILEAPAEAVQARRRPARPKKDPEGTGTGLSAAP